jgi:hypothetical protein
MILETRATQGVSAERPRGGDPKRPRRLSAKRLRHC